MGSEYQNKSSKRFNILVFFVLSLGCFQMIIFLKNIFLKKSLKAHSSHVTDIQSRKNSIFAIGPLGLPNTYGRYCIYEL
jgi:hypothetical protein